MKAMSRRMFAVLTATMMAAALGLGGCASDGGQETAAEGDKAPAAPAQEQESQGAASGGDAATGEPVELQIFAANSLTKAMDEAQELYTSQHPNVTFAPTQYEGSGTLVEMLADSTPMSSFPPPRGKWTMPWRAVTPTATLSARCSSTIWWW